MLGREAAHDNRLSIIFADVWCTQGRRFSTDASHPSEAGRAFATRNLRKEKTHTRIGFQVRYLRTVYPVLLELGAPGYFGESE